MRGGLFTAAQRIRLEKKNRRESKYSLIESHNDTLSRSQRSSEVQAPTSLPYWGRGCRCRLSSRFYLFWFIQCHEIGRLQNVTCASGVWRV